MTEIVPLHPFLFDHDFDAADAATTRTVPGGVAGDAARAIQMEQALAGARAEGFSEGHRSGVAEASAAIDHRVACALDALKGELAALGAELRQQEEDIGRQAATLAAVICHKFLPSRYGETATDEIAGLVAALLPRIAEMPKVSVRVAEALVAPLAERLSDVAGTAGFPGVVETIGDAGIAEGDCHIDWLRGGALRDAAALWREVNALFGETLGAIAIDPPASGSVLDNPLKRVSRHA